MGVSPALRRKGEGHNETRPNANSPLRSGKAAEWRGALSWRSIAYQAGRQEEGKEENAWLEGSEEMDGGN